jgi:hypothetical protein
MTFWNDLGDGFKRPFEWAYHKFERVDRTADHAADTADRVVDGAGKAAQGLGDLLSGNSNILMYAGLGIVAVVVLPKLIDRIL